MHLARSNLILSVVLALGVTALAAPPSLAQLEPLAHNQFVPLIAQQEVHNGSDLACPAVTPSPAPSPAPTTTSGGCRIHYTSDVVDFVYHLSAGGTEVSVGVCAMEFDLRIDSDAEGYASHQEFAQGQIGACTRRPCGNATPPPGEARAFSFFTREFEPEPELATMLFCHEAPDGTNPGHCEVNVVMTSPTLHRTRLSASDVRGHGSTFPQCEMDGVFNQEQLLQTTGEGQLEQRVEIRHR
ncbi:MAG TPA: hypothetical protein VEX36_03185 [Thermoleophilaceae bacterium]|nr:hypothetical protein [Thermoleophilaceae bacterium]